MFFNNLAALKTPENIHLLRLHEQQKQQQQQQKQQQQQLLLEDQRTYMKEANAVEPIEAMSVKKDEDEEEEDDEEDIEVEDDVYF